MGITTTSSSKSYLKNVSLKFSSGAVGFVLSIASSIIVARALGAKGNGTLVLLIQIPTIIAELSSLGVNNANGYLVGARKHTPQAMVGNSLSLAMMLSLLTGTGYWIAMPLWMRFLSESDVSRSMLALAFLIAPFSLLEMYLNGILLGLERIAQLSIVSIARFSSLLTLNIILVLILRLGVWGAVLAAIVAPAICVVMYAFFLRNDVNRVRFGWERRALKDSLVFGIQVHLGNVLYVLGNRLDIFIVNLFMEVTDVGFYAVSVSLAQMLLYVPQAFAFVLFPRTAASDSKTAKRFTPKVARLSGFITAVAAVGLLLVSRLVITLLYTEEFLPALYPLWILLPGIVSLSYAQVIFSDLSGRGKPYYSTLAYLLPFFVAVGFDFLLIPQWGIIGAATASSLSCVMNAVIAMFIYLRLTGNKLTDVLLVQKSDIKAIFKAGREMVLALSQMLCA